MIEQFGNVLAATALLQKLAFEDIETSDLDNTDPLYAVITGIWSCRRDRIAGASSCAASPAILSSRWNFISGAKFPWMRTQSRIVRYQIDEMVGDDLVASHDVVGMDPLDALRKIASGPFIESGEHLHWYRVVDEERASVQRFGVIS